MSKEAAVIHISQDRRMFGHFCGLDTVHVMSLCRHGYGVALVFVLTHHSQRAALSLADGL